VGAGSSANLAGSFAMLAAAGLAPGAPTVAAGGAAPAVGTGAVALAFGAGVAEAAGGAVAGSTHAPLSHTRSPSQSVSFVHSARAATAPSHSATPNNIAQARALVICNTA